MKNKITTTVMLIIMAMIGCANQQSPSGGPDDTIGPSPVTTSPATESVNIPEASAIEIVFSEWILPSSVKGITIFPTTPFKAKVTANRIVIKPKGKLRNSTTYHCVITSSLKDLHNNPISKPVSIIFSTGPVLDSGSTGGCVNDSRRAELMPNVALFKHPADSGDSGFSSVPDYLTQTDSNGVFQFKHIRTGTYRLVAYLDKNSDGKLQNSTEEIYLPPDSIIRVGAELASRAMLYPSRYDTTRQNIASLLPLNSSTMLGTWKKPFDSLVNPSAPGFIFESIDSPIVSFKATGRIEYNTTRFFLTPDSLLDSIPYRLIFSLKSIFDTILFTDTLRVMGASQRDTIKPTLIRSKPGKMALLRPSIDLIWSELVSCKGPFTAADTLGDTITLVCDSIFTDSTRFTVPRSLEPGRTYQMVILTNNAHDLQGNPLKARDSTDTAAIVSFTTIPFDSLAVSLSGTAPCLDTSDKRIWLWQLLESDVTHTVADRKNCFRFDSIPSGRGLLTTFIDYNSNGKPDAGSLLPFAAPEPVITFPDTLEARARWDVEGIELTPCDQCERKKRDRERDVLEKDEKKNGQKKEKNGKNDAK